MVFIFFHKSALPDWVAAYLRTWIIHGRLRYYQFRDRIEDSTEELQIKKRNIKNKSRKVVQAMLNDASHPKQCPYTLTLNVSPLL